MGNARSKQNAKLAADLKPQKKLVGKKVMYVGICGATNTCPSCGRIQNKGMLSKYQEQLFCGERCVLVEAGTNQ